MDPVFAHSRTLIAILNNLLNLLHQERLHTQATLLANEKKKKKHRNDLSLENHVILVRGTQITCYSWVISRVMLLWRALQSRDTFRV
jgi:hypothetical protein